MSGWVISGRFTERLLLELFGHQALRRCEALEERRGLEERLPRSGLDPQVGTDKRRLKEQVVRQRLLELPLRVVGKKRFGVGAKDLERVPGCNLLEVWVAPPKGSGRFSQ